MELTPVVTSVCFGEPAKKLATVHADPRDEERGIERRMFLAKS
jgi:hypothetical protein